MENLLHRHSGWLVGFTIVAVAFCLAQVLPNDYRIGADEGTYYRQAHMLVEHGIFAGYQQIAHDYISLPQQQDYPNPLRIGTILVVSLALHVHDGFRCQSWVSLISFLILLSGTWRFVVRFWNPQLALATVLLLAASPLALDMARRALMDSIAVTTAAFSVFAFFHLLQTHARWLVLRFVAVTTIAILVKETAVLLLPFYAGVFVYCKLRKEIELRWRQILWAIALPPMLAVVAYLAAYGVNNLIAIVQIVLGVMQAKTPYVVNLGSGPWYRYPLDFLVLSPWVFLMAVMWSGSLIFSQSDRWMRVLLALGIYLLFAYAPLTKSVRYLLLLDLPLRLFAAAMLLAVSRQVNARVIGSDPIAASDSAQIRWLRGLPVIALILLVGNDVAAFQRYFLAGRIYDPQTYNLLRIDHIVPSH